MKLATATVALLCLIGTASAQTRVGPGATPMAGLGDMRTMAPALEKYTEGRLLGDVWKRPGLASRDRGIVTLSALIARNQTIEMRYYLNLALDNGVKPREISEIITRLALKSSSARLHPEWYKTRRTCCFATFGCVRTWRRAIAVW